MSNRSDLGNEDTTFSILGRIEWIATRERAKQSLQVRGFQYPRSDRVDCNGVGLGDFRATIITFSILGRIEWIATLPAGAPLSVIWRPFSILGRIEWIATDIVDARYPQTTGFQYPRSDRVDCNQG